MTTTKPTSSEILVTGATGFTGGHLCQRLAAEGHAVRALVRDAEATTARYQALREAGIELAEGDLRDAEAVQEAARGVKKIYHIAALFRPENVTRQDMWDVNVQGTKNILDAAVNAGVERFVHCSTIGVHGSVKEYPAGEDASFNPGDPYQETKLEGEQLARRYMDQERLPMVIFRPAGIYGPGDLRFLKLLKAVYSGRFVMIGSGEVMYHMIYIDDLIDGILLCGRRDEAIGETYILAGKEAQTLNCLTQTIADVLDVAPPRLKIPFTPVYLAGVACEMVCKPLGIHPPLYRRRVDFFRKTRWFDISKAQQELGFDPDVNVETGIARTAQWYQEAGLL